MATLRARIREAAASGRGLGRVVPTLVAVLALADAGLRVLPVGPLTFRGWEALKRFRPPGAAFEPGRRYHNPRSYGDLAAMGNLPELRQYRAETFTTDVLGFRNAGDPWRPRVSAIVVGDSFAVGAGLNDDEDLATALSRSPGCRFYNAGGIDPDPDRILALARRLEMREGLVIHEYHEDFDLPAVPTGRRRRYQEALASLDPSLGATAGWIRGLVTVSPLRIACERAFKRLENDRALPNRHAENVVRRTLVTGDPVLFLPAAIERYERPRPADVSYWRWMQKELRRGELELFVVLVPGKYTVYRPLLAGAPPAVEGAGDYLERVEAELLRSGVPALSLGPPLAADAAHALESREYLYWRDDIHWTPRGAQTAARALRAGLRESFGGRPWECSDGPYPSEAGSETARRSAPAQEWSSASPPAGSSPDSITMASRASSAEAARRTSSNP